VRVLNLRGRVSVVVLAAALLAGCARHPAVTPASPTAPFQLPAVLASSAEALPPGAAGYARADLPSAVKAPGEGNVSRAMVIQLTQDIRVFRLWSGPDKKDANGRTNRIGSWWTYDPPRGAAAQYRVDYEICRAWNDLTFVATCTLKKGAIVAIGPGNSVSAETCGDKTGHEHYPANEGHWQLYVYRAFERVGPVDEDTELDCPDESRDYEADPRNLAIQKPRDEVRLKAHPAGSGIRGAL
jgi:hypothetical protein